MRRIFVTALLIAGCVSARDARADTHEDADRAFREARALFDAHDYAAACARFAQSQRLEPAAGTLLNLADCYERLGRIASAWSIYKEAAVAAALRKRRDWERFALDRIEALRPAVPTLMIRMSAAVRVDGLIVTRDGQAVAPDDLGLEIPVDPGQHVIVASAPAREPWTTTIDVSRGRAYVVEVGAPGAKEGPKSPAPISAAAPEAPPPAVRPWQRPVGFVAGAVGIVAIGFGAVAGAVAIGARKDAVSMCPSYPSACLPEGTAANERAFGWATASTVAFIGGGLLTAAGVVLVLTAPRSMSARLGVSPLGSLHVAGEF